MNILILNWRDIKHPLAGGAEISLFEHAKKWKESGANVIWFSSAFSYYKKEEEIDGIKFIRSGSQITVHITAFFVFLFGKLGRPDIVIDSFHFLPFFSPLYIFKAKKIALINEVAGKLWFSNIIFPISLIGFFLEKISFIFYKKSTFITASKSTENDLLKIGIDKKRVHTILNGVTLVKLKKRVEKEKNPTIIFLGRISDDKGIKDAFKAFEQVYISNNKVEFFIAGKEEKKGIIDNLINSLDKSCRRNVKYFGFVSEEKKFELLRKAWILIHPSMKEGWGLNVIEAASQQTPTVGYDVEGLRDSIIDSKTGILSQPNSLSLAEDIMKILNDDKLRYKLSKNAQEWSKNFNWEKSATKSWKVITSDE